jgi:FtsX extracellular domain
MSSRIREALADLEHDVAALRLAPPRAIRARGTWLRRRRVVGAVATAAAVTGAVALPYLYAGRTGNGSEPLRPGASPSASCVAPSTTAPPTSFSVTPDPALARSRTVRVFLALTTTPAQKAAVQARLQGLRGVATFEFEDRQDAWYRFNEAFCYVPELVAATKPEMLPESFVVTLRQPSDYDAVKDAVGAMPGVEAVVRALE